MFSYRHWFRRTLTALCAIGLIAGSTLAQAAESAEHETLSLKPVPLFHIGKFYVTNSMLVSWVVALTVIIFAQIATRKIETVPSGVQNFWEWMVEGLYNFLESIIGSDLVKKTFWFFLIALVIILVSIPWPFRVAGAGRPWL